MLENYNFYEKERKTRAQSEECQFGNGERLQFSIR